MKPLILERNGLRIRVGYRTPQLTGKLTNREKVELARELGMEIIEPQMGKDFNCLEEARALKAAADAAGVSIPSMGQRTPLTDPAAESGFDELLDDMVLHARALGAGYVFVRAFNPPPGLSNDETWRLITKRGRRAAERLAQEGIRLGFEAAPRMFVHSFARQRRALELIDHPNCYLNYDPTNHLIAGENPLEAIREFPDRIVSGHIKDGFHYGLEDCGEMPHGRGEMDYVKVFRALLESGAAPDMFIEHCWEAGEVRSAARHIAGVFEQIRTEDRRPTVLANH